MSIDKIYFNYKTKGMCQWLIIILIYLIPSINSKCIWYGNTRSSFNQLYLHGEPKPLPLNEVHLLNEICPHIETHDGISPYLCCDGKQLAEMKMLKPIHDILFSQYPSCYYNLCHIFCEMACSPNQDQIAWPLEIINITRPNENNTLQSNDKMSDEWTLEDYVDPDEEITTTTVKPTEIVSVIGKLRYVLLEKHAQDFIDSCWDVQVNSQYVIDILCGSLNRSCDYKKLFEFIGLKNSYEKLKIDFVFVNGTYYDTELDRKFQPPQASMFTCDQPVILPHISKPKCTCMVRNKSLFPILKNNSKNIMILF
ncbi:unnamed protein product [Rotaria sp. Silwood2]|nr:unnamed protein product [Rotaria sp. Silwood2]